MWYEKTTALNFNKPIYAKDSNIKYILLPQIKKGNTEIVGYNWFNMITGKYNSCCFFNTAQEAIDCYNDYNYFIYNG